MAALSTPVSQCEVRLLEAAKKHLELSHGTQETSTISFGASVGSTYYPNWNSLSMPSFQYVNQETLTLEEELAREIKRYKDAIKRRDQAVIDQRQREADAKAEKDAMTELRAVVLFCGKSKK